MVRQVAEIVHLRGCFSLRPRRAPTLDILNASTAAERVLRDGMPAVVWLDTTVEALFITERWGSDTVKQRLPLRLDVECLAQPIYTSEEEVTVATVAFKDRESVERFVKLGLHVLPDWLNIRQGALGRNLMCESGHWLLGYQGKALKLQWAGGGLSGMLQLNVHTPGIELIIVEGQKHIKMECVSSLAMACKAIKKHAASTLQLDKNVQHVIRQLQPTLASLHKLRFLLGASAEQQRGAASMCAWIDGGIVAALVDCAASMSSSSNRQARKEFAGEGLCSCDATTAGTVLQRIADCTCVVLRNAGEKAGEQAQLLVTCITSSMCGYVSQAVVVVSLLQLVLQRMADDSSGLWQPLQKACRDPLFLQQALQCYSLLLPRHAGLGAHKLALTGGSALQDDEQQGAGRLSDQKFGGLSSHSGVFSHPILSGSSLMENTPLCESGSPVASRTPSEAGGQAKRPVVPRLSLPSFGPATPTGLLTRSSRLSRRASDMNSPCTGSPMVQNAAVSFAASLQQMGQSCGESVMAADLAAFVTHKQLHATQVISKQGRRGSTAAADTSLEAPVPQQLAWEEQYQLPQALQLQLQLLECIQLLAQQVPAYPLPMSVANLLLSQLLLPQPPGPQQLPEGSKGLAHELLDKGLQRHRHIALQVLAQCTSCQRLQQLSCSSDDDDTRDTWHRQHDSVLAQFKQRLLECCANKRPDAASHSACKEALLLLRDYLHLSSRPGIVEIACSVVGSALGQLEHMLRANRVPLWPWSAVQVMDALVQVYVEMAQQAKSFSAAGYLLRHLGAHQTSNSWGGAEAGGVATSGAGTAVGAAPSDTLQLVLDLLQQRLTAGHTGASSSAAGVAASKMGASSAPVLGVALPEEGVVAGGTGDVLGAEASAAAIKAHCWQLLVALVQLAAGFPSSSSRLAGVTSTTSSASWYSGTGCTNSMRSEHMQHSRLSAGLGLATNKNAATAAAEAATAAASDQTVSAAPDNGNDCAEAAGGAKAGVAAEVGSKHTPCQPASCQSMASPRSYHHSIVGGHGTPPPGSGAGGLPVAHSAVGSPGPTISLSRMTDQASVGASQSRSSSCDTATRVPGAVLGGTDVLQVLVELLMRQRGGRPYIVQQLDESDGGQAAHQLHLELLRFLAAAFAVPDSYPLIVPQLAEFYVHYHFLHFTRHYYKLPTALSPVTVACCKGHVQVLLSLCHQTGGANPVRRRFLQLKVLDFLIREVGLEHALKTKQSMPISHRSSCTTPFSTRSMGYQLALPSSASRGGLVGDCDSGDGSRSNRHVAASVDAFSGLAAGNHDGAIGRASRPSMGNDVPLHSTCLDAPEASAVAEPAETGMAGIVHNSTSSTNRSSDSHSLVEGQASTVSEQRCVGSKPAAGQLEHVAAVGQNVGSVRSAVQAFEAAAAAAAAAAVAPAVPERRDVALPSRHRLVVRASLSQAASGGKAVQLQQQQQPLRPRPPAAPRHPHPLRATAVVLNGSSMACVSKELSTLQAISDQLPQLNLESSNRAAAAAADSAAACQQLATVADAAAPVAAASAQPLDQAHSSVGLEGASNSQQELQQPKLTGDVTVDNELIDEWEERTGLQFVWDRLSDSEEAADDGASDACLSPCTPISSPPAANRGAARFVPRLNFQPQNGGAADEHAVSGASATEHLTDGSDSADGSGAEDDCSGYRPGLDLEDDFERLMSAEESGRQGAWAFSSDDSSDDSDLIAVGRDDELETGGWHGQRRQGDEQRTPVCSEGHAQSSAACKQTPADSTCTAAVIEREDLQALEPTVLGTISECVPLPALIDDDTASEGSLQEGGDSSFEDDVGLQEEDVLQLQLPCPADGAACQSHTQDWQTSRCAPRPAMVPQLKLPTFQVAAAFSPAFAAMPDSATSSSPANSPGVARAPAPSLLATATPLITSRPAAAAGRQQSLQGSSRTAVKGQVMQQHCASAGKAGQQGSGPEAAASVYNTHRQARAVYVEEELHVLCLELALHLLCTPSGVLDALQLPHDPTDASLQDKVHVLMEHLSHSANARTVQRLADRARCSSEHVQHMHSGGQECMAYGTGSAAAAAAAAGLSQCTLRLLKLLSSAMLDLNTLHLGGMIQKGAFSEIHAATWCQADQVLPVAVKILECSTNDPSCFERVYNEVAVLERLQGWHGVLPLLSYGITNGSGLGSEGPQWLLVFPRYSSSLREWRRSKGKGLQLADVGLYLSIFLQVATIVRDLHAANVVHYDIKGDNLLLDWTNSSNSDSSPPFSVILGDFGDALVCDATGGGEFAHRHRGTELFSSPEMLLLQSGQQHPGNEQHDRRKHRGVGRPHDVWSLGCTLYELLTGRTLFEEQGVGRITSYATSTSCPGGNMAPASGSVLRQPRSSASSGAMFAACGESGVLTSSERAALASHAGLIELLEFILVGDATWRPAAAEVVYKAQQLLSSIGRGTR